MKAICEEYGFEKGYVTESDLDEITAIHYVAERTMYGSSGIKTLQDLELLPNLTELSIEQFGSGYTQDFLKGINKCKRLTSISFAGCHLDSLERLTVLEQLEELNLAHCTGISDYSLLGKIANLKKLSISGEDIDKAGGLGFVSELHNLEQLSIWTPQMDLDSSFAELNFSNLKNLKKLSIVGYYDAAKILGELRESGAYRNITDLRITIEMWKKECGKDVLCEFVGLKNLFLSINDDSDPYDEAFTFNLDGIEKLINLRKLRIRISGYGLSDDASLNAISKLKNLETIAMNSIAQNSFDFLNGLTKLKHIVMYGVERDVSLKEFSSLSSLETIAISGEYSYTEKKFDLAGIDELPALKNIYSVNFAYVNKMLMDDHEDVQLFDSYELDAMVAAPYETFEFMD